MLSISNKDIEKLKKKIIDGCQQFIFDINYTDKFLEINNINFEPDSVIFFKNRNYSNPQIFQIIFTNCLIRNYSDIDDKLLNMLKKIASSNNKIIVSTLMAYTCLESINANLDINNFINKFKGMQYFVENYFNESPTKPKLIIETYYDLFKHQTLFCSNEETLRSKEEIAIIIEKMHQQTPINFENFDSICTSYENFMKIKSLKKM